jgi:hypothetical protein
MYTITIHVQCSERFSEVLPYELEDAELVVEDLVGRVLLELFWDVTVQGVMISFSPSEVEDEDALP